ncbi:hypothetical protein [Mucilaginibacter phyllosphaerae]|uniref:Uncharacterized protein n=1 Tax=Mucilaginibacter phyllosphaerae TaxID=1812349 RepID=A0A4Y8AIZ2_9SPHI|nr:hypothetical protein [Mucilaginibacter phyllosphaerae]MBB3967948.1 hypothetical protein [Mucilaginibacter phyllosphaerae]TEW69014.1 hypothetical protein E2R65_02295 [Mucilaginibacter phyllosphaerae]GGH02255.1 hypothetical protein GCM10007352_04370 [Mucilaginibacter phyllosphaerae]
MKPYTILSICTLALASCAGSGNKGADTTKTTAGDTSAEASATWNAPAQNMEYCFIHTEGTSNQQCI